MKRSEVCRAPRQFHDGLVTLSLSLAMLGAAACGVENGPTLDDKAAKADFVEQETTFVSHDSFGNAYRVVVRYDESIADDVAALPFTFRVVSGADVEADAELATFLDEYGDEIALSREHDVEREPGAMVVLVEPIGDSPAVVGREFGVVSGFDEVDEDGKELADNGLVAKAFTRRASGNTCNGTVRTSLPSNCFYATHRATAECGGTSWATARAVDRFNNTNWISGVSTIPWNCPQSVQGNLVYESSGRQRTTAVAANNGGCTQMSLKMTCW